MLAALAVLAMAACGEGAGGAGGGSDQFTDRAEEVLAAWRSSGAAEPWQSGLIPLDPVDWVERDGDKSIYQGGDAGEAAGDAKLALAGGSYRLSGALPTEAPPDATVRFPDGGALTVPVMTAQAAFDALNRQQVAADCTRPTCTLTVTGAQLGTAPIRTSRGEAEVPVWRFTVTELTVPVVRLAAGPSGVVTLDPPKLEYDLRFSGVEAVVPAAGPAEASAAAASPAGAEAAGTTALTLHFTGGACMDTTEGLVYETDDAVVLGVRIISKPGTCIALGVPSTTSATLAAPLGSRVLLDATSGQPLLLGDCRQIFGGC
jgi:hypothetical protein